jgi:hypothetical protein
VALRRRHAWLVDAAVSTSELSNTTMAIHLTGGSGEQLTLALNVSDEARTVAGMWVPAHGFQHST